VNRKQPGMQIRFLAKRHQLNLEQWWPFCEFKEVIHSREYRPGIVNAGEYRVFWNDDGNVLHIGFRFFGAIALKLENNQVANNLLNCPNHTPPTIFSQDRFVLNIHSER